MRVAHGWDVADVAHLISEMTEVAEEDVESYGGAGVPEMGVAIYRRSADIHSDTAFVQGSERLLGAGERVVDA